MENNITSIGEEEASDIRAQVARILRDLGNPEPPLVMSDVMNLLDLDFSYYSSSDLSFFDELSHKIRIAGKQVMREPGRFIDAIKKARLSALWLPNGSQILMDDNVPSPKQRHLQAHEVTHSITPWHRSFLFGDNELTLTAHCHCIIEAEANYGAGQLLFMGDRFAGDVRDGELSWKYIQSLQRRYKNTLTTTLWHTVEERDPNVPLVGLIGSHPRHPSIGRASNGTNIRHFIRSPCFKKRFPATTANDISGIVSTYVGFSKRGPCGTGEQTLRDANGEEWEFVFDSFCNTYDLLTYGMPIRRKRTLVPISAY